MKRGLLEDVPVDIARDYHCEFPWRGKMLIERRTIAIQQVANSWRALVGVVIGLQGVMAEGLVMNEARRVCEWRRGVESEGVANLLTRVIDKLLDQCLQVLQLEEAVFFRKWDGIRPAFDRFVVICTV